jgi:hypothetical protein
MGTRSQGPAKSGVCPIFALNKTSASYPVNRRLLTINSYTLLVRCTI